ncbi:MAG: hypothetical protein V1725_01180 [archaeon]
MNALVLRGHHLCTVCGYICHKEMHETRDPFQDYRKHKYGEAFITHCRTWHELLYQQPSQKITIVSNVFDLFCQGPCGMKSPACLEGDADIRESEKLGFHVGNTYTMRDVISVVREKYGLWPLDLGRAW